MSERIVRIPSGVRAAADETRLTAYLAAAGAIVAAETADGAIVAHTTPVPFGINGEVNIDFNGDGQIDFQIDHDRVDLNGTPLDYLQIDKNDFNGASNPLDFDSFLPDVNYHPFPLNGTPRNSDAEYLQFSNSFGDTGGYAVALKAGDMIGASGLDSLVPGTVWDWQENDNFAGTGMAIRANRLIDEDAGQLDSVLAGRQVQQPIGPNLDFPDLDGWLGLNGETRYVGVRIDLNDALEPGLNSKDLAANPNIAEQFYYGWIGLQITNEADATGVVTGWAYESTPGVPIAAGDTGPFVADPDFNNDGNVDGTDFLIWQRGFGSTVAPGAGADGTGDGMIDGADLALWNIGYGTGSVVSVAGAVPEPGAIGLTIVGALLLAGCFVVRRWKLRQLFSAAR